MSRRPEYTLILVTDHTVVRADFAGSQFQAVAETETYERAAEASLPECVQQVIEGELPLARRVGILSTSVWNQIVSMTRLGIDSLEHKQLAEALKFEVEPLIGIDADAATIGFTEIEGERDHRRFWTNVCLQAEWDSIREMLRTRKVRDVVIAHPVVASKSPGKPALEFWDQTVFQIDESGLLVRVHNATPGSDRWINDFGFDSISSARNNQTVLLAPQNEHAELGADQGSLLDLNQPKQLDDWLRAAAMRLESPGQNRGPVIRQVRQSSGSPRKWLLRAAALIVVVGFCGWHLAWLKGNGTQIQQQITQLEQPEIEKQKFDAQLGEVLQKREKFLEQSVLTRGMLHQVSFFFENQTDRMHTLLEKLVEFRTRDLVIKQIAVTEKGTMVSGVSLDSDAAPLLTSRLRDSVSFAGWKIHPASQAGQMKMTNGGPWTFSILLEDVGPQTLLRESRNSIVRDGTRGGDQ